MAYFRCGGGLPTQQKSITATTSQQIVLPDEGNVLEKVTVNPQKHSTTATPTTRTAQYNLGEYHTVRYINTNSVPNNNTQTKTITTRGSSIDLGGATHNYRYVDTTGVPSLFNIQTPYTNPNPSSTWLGTAFTFSWSYKNYLAAIFYYKIYKSDSESSEQCMIIPLKKADEYYYYDFQKFESTSRFWTRMVRIFYSNSGFSIWCDHCYRVDRDITTYEATYTTADDYLVVHRICLGQIADNLFNQNV